jgi:hypothetical protein
MQMANPSPSEIRQALLDFGVDVKFYQGWDTVGRPWQGPDGSPGLTGGVIHHTANPNAKVGGSINGVLGWAVTAYDKPVCNMLIGKDANQGTWLLAAGSVYHCGDGGPVPALGIPSRGYLGQTRLFGIEIDDPGVSPGTITEYQIENTSKTMAALAQLAVWNIDKSILTHKCYTDGCHGANPNGPSPCVGRKNDTLDGPWATWPGDQTPKEYNALWWRDKIKSYSTPRTWDGTIPSRTACLKSYTDKINNKAAWRLACRLYDVGVKRRPAAALGTQEYPLIAMKKYQEQIGIRLERQDGLPNKTTWIKLFGKDKP